MQLDDGSEVVYAKTLDNMGKGTLVDKAVIVDAEGGVLNCDAELEQTDTWTSLETFIKYGSAWSLEVPDEGLKLELHAPDRTFKLAALDPHAAANWKTAIQTHFGPPAGSLRGPAVAAAAPPPRPDRPALPPRPPSKPPTRAPPGGAAGGGGDAGATSPRPPRPAARPTPVR